MNKDVIYVDVEDDITDIIEKVKASKEKIIALVPPKRVGALSSVVSLKLLGRVSKQNGKNVVLVSSNEHLLPLAAVAGLPVARTLQSRPEVPEIDALEVSEDNQTDIIDGETLPISEFDKAAGKDAKNVEEADAEVIDSIALEDEEPEKGKKKEKKNRVPNFNKFRAKLLIFGSLALLVAGALVWALVFAPAATVVVTAKTNTSSVNETVTLVTDLNKVDEKTGILLLQKKEIIKKPEVSFTPTGKKDVGEKAKGEMTLKRTLVTSVPISIPAGTTFSDGSLVFVATTDATLAGVTQVDPSGPILTETTVQVEAADIGEEYNVAEGAYSSQLGGFTSYGSAMTGGTRRNVTVVSEEDITKAKVELDKQIEEAKQAVRKESETALGSGVLLVKKIDDADVVVKDIKSTPEKDTEATESSAKLSTEVVVTVYGTEKSSVGAYLDSMLAERIKNEAGQKVYSNGLDEVWFETFYSGEDKTTVRLVTNTVEIGPDISEDDIKTIVMGKNYGQIVAELKSINGISDVEIRYSFFWVFKVPSDENKVKVEFEIAK